MKETPSDMLSQLHKTYSTNCLRVFAAVQFSDMDPSEYEGTVPRVNDPLRITLFEDFEQLLAAPTEKFANIDLSRESDHIHLTMFQIKESLQKWNEVSFNNLRLAWDEQALKIAEYKEEVAARKKIIATKIRYFMSTSAAETSRTNNVSDILGEVTVLITAFKTEFDFLTTTNRFSESAFLSTYKLMRDVPDPSEELGECLKVCVRAQETLKNAQEQLNVAEKNTQGISAPSHNSISQPFAITDGPLAAKYDNQILEIKQSFLADLTSMREKIDLEMRNKEHSLRCTFERQQLDLQQQCEDSLARKDCELSSLMNSLNALNQRNLESEERQGMLETEVQKRRELEERLRVSFTELASAQTIYHEMQAKYDTLEKKMHAAEVSKIRSDKQSTDTLYTAQSQLRILNDRIIDIENELQSRPPADLSALAQSVGMVGGSLTDITLDQTWTKEKPLTKKIVPWSKIEIVVIDCIRRASSEATESRVKEQGAMKTLETVKAECDQLNSILKEKGKIIDALEKDFLAAHESINERNALLNCDRKGIKPESSYGINNFGNNLNLNITEDPQCKEDGDGHVVDVSEMWSTLKKESHLDIERASGGRGIAAAVLGETGSGGRMIVAVQGQRDRFMKIAHTKEAEVNSLRIQLDRVVEEQKVLSHENLELFRRLRLQRASSRQPNDRRRDRDIEEDRDGSPKLSSYGDGSYRSGTQSPSKSRNRRDVRQNPFLSSIDVEDASFERTDGDLLERKYMHLYEEKIDPFRLEELDRLSVLSRMNVFERGLAYLTRFFLHDQWARHALMVYLLLVHGFALCYVFQVLNPQLIEEVDYHLKSKWSSETLNMNVDREHPDAR